MEYRKLCNVCGQIFCYTDEDIAASKSANVMSVISSLGAATGAISGNWVAARANQAQGQYEEGKITDFDHCPHCHSTSLKLMSNGEWQEYQRKMAEPSKQAVNISINANASKEALIKRAYIFLEDREWASAETYANQVLDMDPECGEAYFILIYAKHEISSDDDVISKELRIIKTEGYNKIKRYASEDLLERISKIDNAVCEHIYKRGIAGFSGTSSYEECDYTIRAMSLIAGYKDASEIQVKAEKRQHETVFEEIYCEAEKCIEIGTEFKLNEAIRKFYEIIEWRDSKDRVAECKQKILELKEREAQKNKKIVRIIISSLVGVIAIGIICYGVAKGIDYIKANNVISFRVLYDSGDSKDYIMDDDRYEGLISLIEKEDYMGAAKYAEEYDVLDRGDIDKLKIAGIFASGEYSNIQNAGIGDVVVLGEYPQDSDSPSPVEWQVLDKTNDSVLLLSKYCIETENMIGGGNWDTCSSREMLNGIMYESLFSADEKLLIKEVNVTTTVSNEDFTEDIINTKDKLFLLSMYEVNKYLSTADAKLVTTTAKCKDIKFKDNNKYVDWNLRDTSIYKGETYYTIVAYWSDKSIERAPFGDHSFDQTSILRPAMWVSTDYELPYIEVISKEGDR